MLVLTHDITMHARHSTRHRIQSCENSPYKGDIEVIVNTSARMVVRMACGSDVRVKRFKRAVSSLVAPSVPNLNPRPSTAYGADIF